jgi:hypothetical protein
MANLTSARPERAWTDAQRAIAKTVVQTLAGMCDGAQMLDGAGFNKLDAPYGHQLAASSLPLTDREVATVSRWAAKYHRQLPAELVEALK